MTPQTAAEATVSQEVESALAGIVAAVAQPAFQALVAEMRRQPEADRARFVREVVVNPAAHAARGVEVPAGMVVQRSAFKDGRPTLFCVTRQLPGRNLKVTVTFDDPDPAFPG